MAARARGLLPALLYVLAASFTLQAFLAHWEGGLRFEIAPTLAFEMPRPYAYRVLTPLLVRAIVWALPARAAQSAVDHWGHGVLGLSASQAGCAGPPTIQFLVATWIMLGALWGAALVWRALLRARLPGHGLLADVLPALVLLALPATFTGGGFLYDFPEMLLVSAGYLAFARRQWALWYALLPLAVLNKEASALMLVWWLAVLPAFPRRVWWLHAVASGALAASVIVALWWTFRGSPGFVAQPNFAHNVRYWGSLRWLLSTHDAFGTALPLPVAFNALNLAILWATWSRGKGQVPAEVSRAFAVSCAAVAPLLLLFGFENEIRVFAVALPPLVLLAGGAMASLYSPVERP